MDKVKFGGGRQFGYAMCNVALGVGTVPMNMLLLFYLTEVAGMRATLAGLVVALPKIWDALVDPMFGGWVDQYCMRTGRRGPATLIACGAYVLALILVFSLPALVPASQMMVAATVLLIVSSMAETGIGITQFARAAEMTSSEIELSGLLSLSAVTAQVLAVVCSIVAPMLVIWSGGGATGYTRMAAEVGALMALFILIFLVSTRRVPVRVRDPGSVDMSLMASLRATAANHSFFYLIAFVACTNAGAAVIFGFLPFANRYVLGGSQGDLGLLEGILGVSVLVGMLGAPSFVKRLNIMASMRLCNVLVGLMLAVLFGASFAPLWATWIALAGVGLASGTIGVLVQTATLSATRLKLKGGTVVAIGFYLGIMLAGMKLGNSAGGFASGQLLDLVGFVPGGAAQSVMTLKWLRVGYTLLPLVFVIWAGLFLRRVVLPEQNAEQEQLLSARVA